MWQVSENSFGIVTDMIIKESYFAASNQVKSILFMSIESLRNLQKKEINQKLLFFCIWSNRQTWERFNFGLRAKRKLSSLHFY